MCFSLSQHPAVTYLGRIAHHHGFYPVSCPQQWLQQLQQLRHLLLVAEDEVTIEVDTSPSKWTQTIEVEYLVA
jgi:hypothetical protein